MTWAAFDDDFLSIPATKSRRSVAETVVVDATESDITSQERSSAISCCGRLVTEFTKRPHFQTKDPANGRVINISASFAPEASFVVVFWKLLFLTAIVGYIVYDWLVEGPQTVLYLALPTHWTFLFAAVYAVLSLGNTLIRTSGERVSSRIALTWVFGELALHSVTLMAVVNCADAFVPHPGDHDDRDISDTMIATVILSFFLIGDLFVIHRIPFRWLHWFFYILPIESLWVVWSVIYQLVLHLKNPYNENPHQLFNHVDWEQEPVESTIYCVAVLVGAGFVLFGILWWVSIYQLPCCSCFVGAGFCNWRDKRHYLDSFQPDERPSDAEEGFAQWRR
ncbi:hypothetical protein FisN_22Hh207 [Fistulifera solaris]|jgi:hypothetical protein|uniref:Transmembrane protein n=1 Tax=Fistulifera solaris TaxID=1519565 RepID=A0A1Z5JPG9_FISSO|nr:hypothetical protein FisN_22Hh207 [Fistulifera solaris]|eukprot:GAX15943.1 hypothetical protein FisN_22Hh207 [Fistulifera solaris]